MCGKPKEKTIEVLGTTRTVGCMCDCEIQEYKARKDEWEKEQRQIQLSIMRKSKKNKGTFDQDDMDNEKVSRICQKYAETFSDRLKEGQGLLLYGNVGSGKSFLASCIADTVTEEGFSCEFTSFARIVNEIESAKDKQKYIDDLNRFDLLIIDDLSSERDTEYMGEIVQNVIDTRYDSRKPVVITTNLTADELKNPTGIRKQRIYSRLLEMTIPVAVEHKDRRRSKLIEKHKELKDVLGL